MPNVRDEPPLLASEVRKWTLGRFGDGRHAHKSTVIRWIARGVPHPVTGERIKLEAYRDGHKWVTSRPALDRFRDALSADPTAVRARTPAARRKAHERAEAELAAAGL